MKIAHLYLKLKLHDKVEIKHILKLLREHHIIIQEHLMQELLTEEQEERLHKQQSVKRDYFFNLKNLFKKATV